MAFEFNASFSGNETIIDLKPIVSTVGDFTPFYIAIALSTTLLSFILLINIVFCCSRYSSYWLDRHTGNRWIVSIWSETPHKQPPLDFTELKIDLATVQYVPSAREYHDDLHQEFYMPPSISQQPLTASQEYLELHKRESDI